MDTVESTVSSHTNSIDSINSSLGSKRKFDSTILSTNESLSESQMYHDFTFSSNSYDYVIRKYLESSIEVIFRKAVSDSSYSTIAYANMVGLYAMKKVSFAYDNTQFDINFDISDSITYKIRIYINSPQIALFKTTDGGSSFTLLWTLS